MPFPFLPAGVVLAASVLIGALVAFGLILRAMDRAIVGLRDNMLTGLVSGLRTWRSAGRDHLIAVSSPASSESPWGGSGSGAMPSGGRSTNPASAPTAEAMPSPEVIDLGSRPIERQSEKRR
jgi:hypothetical protein